MNHRVHTELPVQSTTFARVSRTKWATPQNKREIVIDIHQFKKFIFNTHCQNIPTKYMALEDN